MYWKTRSWIEILYYYDLWEDDIAAGLPATKRVDAEIRWNWLKNRNSHPLPPPKKKSKLREFRELDDLLSISDLFILSITKLISFICQPKNPSMYVCELFPSFVFTLYTMPIQINCNVLPDVLILALLYHSMISKSQMLGIMINLFRGEFDFHPPHCITITRNGKVLKSKLSSSSTINRFMIHTSHSLRPALILRFKVATV